MNSFFSELKPESKKKERRKDDKSILKGENTSTTDEELMDSQRKSYFCFVISYQLFNNLLI